MEKLSVLNFTYEMSVNNLLPFLDISIQATSTGFETTVYVKPTDAGHCLNFSSECSLNYKRSVITSHVRRAYKVCSSWVTFDNEIKRVKQLLINNGYSNSFVDSETSKMIDKLFNRKDTEKHQNIKLYYKNQMSSAYKMDEKVIKDIINRNVKCTNKEMEVQTVIYYKNSKVKNLVMANNLLQPKKSGLQRTNVVYKFKCPEEDCKLLNADYIGVTTTTLSRRITMHLQNGAIRKHFEDTHEKLPSRKTLETATEILYSSNDKFRLWIMEAILIRDGKPIINKQDTGIMKTLKL